MKALKLLIYLGYACGFSCFFGCSKDEPSAPETATYTPSAAPTQTYQPSAPQTAPTNQKQSEAFPGEQRIRAALSNQDYHAAVVMYFSVKPTVEQYEAYHRFSGEMKDTLMQASSQDPRAEQALMAMRMARQPMPPR